MKKVMLTSAIVTVVGLALIIISAVLKSIVIGGDDFNVEYLTAAFDAVGYLMAVLGGVLWAATDIAGVVRGSIDARKLTVCSIVAVSIGLTLILTAAILNSLRGAINTGDFTINSIAAVFSQIGYLMAILSGVVLVSMAVAGLAKESK
jgi:hypothetical protein